MCSGESEGMLVNACVIEMELFQARIVSDDVVKGVEFDVV